MAKVPSQFNVVEFFLHLIDCRLEVVSLTVGERDPNRSWSYSVVHTEHIPSTKVDHWNLICDHDVPVTGDVKLVFSWFQRRHMLNCRVDVWDFVDEFYPSRTREDWRRHASIRVVANVYVVLVIDTDLSQFSNSKRVLCVDWFQRHDSQHQSSL